MRGENAGHTLQATVLVNEAFLRLVDVKITWQNRAHFIAIAARNMRHILVDHAKAKGRKKRGGDAFRVTLHETRVGGSSEPDILDLEDALTQLAKVDGRKAQVIELSFYGGLTYDEIVEVMEISPACALPITRIHFLCPERVTNSTSTVNGSALVIKLLNFVRSRFCCACLNSLISFHKLERCPSAHPECHKPVASIESVTQPNQNPNLQFW